MALTRRCPASLAGRRALAPRIWGGRAHALIGYPGLRPTSPRTPGRGPARPFHGPLRETRNGHTPVTSQYSVHLDESLNGSLKVYLARRRNSVLRSKVYLHNSSQHRCCNLRAVIARRNSLRPVTANKPRSPRDDVVGSRLVARIARIRTRHTAGAHAPMNTPNEHPMDATRLHTQSPHRSPPAAHA